MCFQNINEKVSPHHQAFIQESLKTQFVGLYFFFRFFFLVCVRLLFSLIHSSFWFFYSYAFVWLDGTFCSENRKLSSNVLCGDQQTSKAAMNISYSFVFLLLRVESRHQFTCIGEQIKSHIQCTWNDVLVFRNRTPVGQRQKKNMELLSTTKKNQNCSRNKWKEWKKQRHIPVQW